jgi:hypothetical protein
MMGHERRFGGQAATSGLPWAADVMTGCWQVSEGPIPDLSICNEVVA